MRHRVISTKTENGKRILNNVRYCIILYFFLLCLITIVVSLAVFLKRFSVIIFIIAIVFLVFGIFPNGLLRLCVVAVPEHNRRDIRHDFLLRIFFLTTRFPFGKIVISREVGRLYTYIYIIHTFCSRKPSLIDSTVTVRRLRWTKYVYTRAEHKHLSIFTYIFFWFVVVVSGNLLLLALKKCMRESVWREKTMRQPFPSYAFYFLWARQVPTSCTFYTKTIDSARVNEPRCGTHIYLGRRRVLL